MIDSSTDAPKKLSPTLLLVKYGAIVIGVTYSSIFIGDILDKMKAAKQNAYSIQQIKTDSTAKEPEIVQFTTTDPAPTPN